MFSAGNVTVLYLTFRSISILGLFFCKLWGFAYRYLIVPAPFVEETILSPLNCLGILVEWAQEF